MMPKMPTTGGGMGRGIGVPGSGAQYVGGLGRGSMLGEQRTQERRIPPDLPPPTLPLCVALHVYASCAHAAHDGVRSVPPLLAAQAYHAAGSWGRHPRRALSEPLPVLHANTVVNVRARHGPATQSGPRSMTPLMR